MLTFHFMKVCKLLAVGRWPGAWVYFPPPVKLTFHHNHHHNHCLDRTPAVSEALSPNEPIWIYCCIVFYKRHYWALVGYIGEERMLSGRWQHDRSLFGRSVGHGLSILW